LTRSCRRRRGKRACKLWFSSLLKRREEKLASFFSAQEKRGKALVFLLCSREERKSFGFSSLLKRREEKLASSAKQCRECVCE